MSFECVDPEVNIHFSPQNLVGGCRRCNKVVFLSLQIREETNTKIDLPAENSNSEMIVITGKKANCEAARNRILAIQKELVKPLLESGF